MSRKVRNDLLLAGGILLAAALFAAIFFLTRKEGGYAVVLQKGEEIARYSLAEEREVPLSDGAGGTNVLMIEGGKARMAEANCPDGICVEHRPISNEGETVVCLPHELVIKIEASDKNAPDMVV